MASQFAELMPEHQRFIARQHIFFVASAAAGGRVNLSPKDGKSLRLLGGGAAVYLDQTGSGNETAAHMLADGRITFMFCALEGSPQILRLYGRGRVVAKGSQIYRSLLASEFGGKAPSGARQMIRIDVELVQTSCGYAVPLYQYVDERPNLERWAEHKGEDGLVAYRQEHNLASIDGLPSGFQE